MRLREQLNALSPKRAVPEELGPAHTEVHQAATEQPHLGKCPEPKTPDLRPRRGKAKQSSSHALIFASRPDARSGAWTALTHIVGRLSKRCASEELRKMS
jgi:hypothetical protein